MFAERTRLFAALLGPACISVFLQNGPASQIPWPGYAKDHVLIKFKSDLRARLPAIPEDELLSALPAHLNLPPAAQLEEPVVNQLLREHAFRSGRPTESGVNLQRFLYLKLPPALSVEDCVARLKDHPWVEYVEPDGIASPALVPSDPEFMDQWFHTNRFNVGADIHTPLAWDITQGSSNVTVAVLDTGLAASLPEFAGRVVPGFNFAYGTTNTDDDYGHGTVVTGILGANANNSNLGAGVDWNCRIMPIKVYHAAGSGSFSWFAQGTDYAVAHGAKVLILSVAGECDSATQACSVTFSTAITNAVAAGAIIVTAAGNNNGPVGYPGNVPLCITVGATEYYSDDRAWFSNYGPELDLLAPGDSILSVWTNGMHYMAAGTSAATPQVAGVCALLVALRPDLTQEQARALLCAGADQITGFNIYYGWGRLNAYNSLLLAQTRIDSAR